MNRTKQMCKGVAGLAVAMAAGTVLSDVVILNPSADTHLDERRPNNNSGATDWIKAGFSENSDERRGLFEFDIAGTIPAGSTIDSVTLTMTVEDGSQDVLDTHGLYRALTDWVEGDSGSPGNGGRNGSTAQAGEATWLTSGVTVWAAPGGLAGVDYASASSASATITTGPGSVQWSGPGLSNDVQLWLDNPSSNNGWFIIGESGADGSARRYDSSQGNAVPQLEIAFTVIPEPTTLILATLGGLSLLVTRRRQYKKSA